MVLIDVYNEMITVWGTVSESFISSLIAAYPDFTVEYKTDLYYTLKD